MRALIDSDWFAYAHGGAKDDEGHPLKWPLVASRISAQIDNILKGAGAQEYSLYLTGDGNFRDKMATIRPYKGNRPTDKPYHYGRVRDFLIKFRNGILVNNMEADDAVSIEQYTSEWKQLEPGNTIICSIDKDLDNTPGWHYNWIKDGRYWVSEEEALRNFYKQLLVGDTVDNIPGLYGVGKQSSLLKKLDDIEEEKDMYLHVKEQYEKRFGSYWKQFLLENAQLLWILREKDHNYKEYLHHWKETVTLYKPEREIKKRLEKLE